MALGENDDQALEEGQIEGEETLTGDEGVEGNEDATGDQAESSSAKDNSGVDRATEARLQRLEERNQYLENTQRILEQFNSRQQGHVNVPQEEALPDDVAALDKLLEPAVNRRFKKGLEPLIGTISELKEETDAAKFDNFLTRTDGELFDPDNEQKLNSVYQQVDNFRRQVAQQRGQWISRQDAYLYLDGVARAKEKIANRSTKLKNGVVAERKRLAQVQTAATLQATGQRRENAGEAALVKKLRSNQRLTQEELNQLRDGSLGDQQF